MWALLGPQLVVSVNQDVGNLINLKKNCIIFFRSRNKRKHKREGNEHYTNKQNHTFYSDNWRWRKNMLMDLSISHFSGYYTFF